MSVKINKNGKEYDLGFVPQSLYDDVEDLKDFKENGGTFGGNVQVDARLDVGGTSRGEIRVYGNNPSYYGRFYNSETDALTANRNYYLPNKDGTLAIEKGSSSREYTNQTWGTILADFWRSRFDKTKLTLKSMLHIHTSSYDRFFTLADSNCMNVSSPSYAGFNHPSPGAGRNDFVYFDNTPSLCTYKRYVYNGNVDVDYTGDTVSATLTMHY